MCMHVRISTRMRTTIEITDEQRAQLLRLAARRGEKGFSHLVQEALERYLAEQADRQERVRAAIDVLGSFDDRSADALESSVKEIRGRWR